MKFYRLNPTFAAFYSDCTFVKYLRLAAQASKLAETAYGAGCNFKGEYTLQGELNSNLFLQYHNCCNQGRDSVDYRDLYDVVYFADLLVGESRVLFNNEAEYADAVTPLYVWMKEAHHTLVKLGVSPIQCIRPLLSDKDFVKFRIASRELDWQSFFFALNNFISVKEKSGGSRTLSSLINKVIDLSYAIEIIA